jgi:photosystem II stability/assembly factor-like uncharacterized protein
MCTHRRRDGHPRRRALRHGRGSALLLCAALLYPHVAHGGVNLWTSNGPSGAVVTALAIDPLQSDTLYAGTSGKGVFQSVDAGGTWRPTNEGLGDIYIEALLVAPDQRRVATARSTLFAASPNHGVFASVDRGQTWTPMNSGLPDGSAHLLAYDSSSMTLYVSTNHGVYRSPDAGVSWTATGLLIDSDPVGEGEPSLGASIDCLAYDQSAMALYACFFDWSNEVGPSWQLLRSTDAGTSWQPVALPSTDGPVALAVAATSPAAIYAVTYAPLTQIYAVLRTTDGGASWQVVGGPIDGCGAGCAIHDIAVDTGAPRFIYAATAVGVFKASDADTGWQAVNTGMSERAVTAVVIDPADPNVAYAATSSGVFGIMQAASCSGDCNGNGVVDVSELVTMIDVALGRQTIAVCSAGDAQHDGVIGVDDVVAAVRSLMIGCGAGE